MPRRALSGQSQHTDPFRPFDDPDIISVHEDHEMGRADSPAEDVNRLFRTVAGKKDAEMVYNHQQDLFDGADVLLVQTHAMHTTVTEMNEF